MPTVAKFVVEVGWQGRRGAAEFVPDELAEVV